MTNKLFKCNKESAKIMHFNLCKYQMHYSATNKCLYNALYIKASRKVLAVFLAGSVYGSESDRVGLLCWV